MPPSELVDEEYAAVRLHLSPRRNRTISSNKGQTALRFLTEMVEPEEHSAAVHAGDAYRLTLRRPAPGIAVR